MVPTAKLHPHTILIKGSQVAYLPATTFKGLRETDMKVLSTDMYE